MSVEFLVTSFIVIVSPGTGVLYTLAAGLSRGSRASVVAAFGCTIGIVPHMAAAIMGLAAVVSAPRPDPKDAKLAVVDFEFLTRLNPPITLREIKESRLFDDWSLVRQGRLSTMAAPKAFVEWVRKKHPKSKI